MICPGRMAPATPRGPATTSSSASSDGRQETMKSQSCATAEGDSFGTPPNASKLAIELRR